jgi:protein tyrosine phosphatase (PTP) superfamily phosphohydrolase (DUF442 family)
MDTGTASASASGSGATSDRREMGRLRFLAYLLVVWAGVGFVLGTATLLGPVRWVARSLRAAGKGQAAEDAAVLVLIGVLVVVSGAVSLWLARRGARASSRRRVAIPVATSLLAAATLGLWLNPRLVAGTGEFTHAAGEKFVFGPYPTEDDLRRIKGQGYAGVISLLHPAVAPFEPKLLRDERLAAERVGIPLIHLPMLPWVSQNAASLDSLRALARGPGGPYYVHCYLGKDRVAVARTTVEAAQGRAPRTASGGRTLDAVRAFERGEIRRLAPGIHLVPFPTDEEYFGYLLGGQVRTVVSLLDPTNAEDRAWVEKERGILAGGAVQLVEIPLPAEPWMPDSALAVARRLRTLRQPLAVHAFLTRSPAAEGVEIAFRTGRAPLPPSLFAEPFRDGAVTLAAPDVAVGPQPTPHEAEAFLRPRGVRALAVVGAREPDGAVLAAARRAGLRVRRFASASEAASALRAGGPWYVFATTADGAALRSAITASLR